MLNNIIPVISKEIKGNLSMNIINNYHILNETCCYSTNTNELYCLNKNTQGEHYILTFSLMDQMLKSKRIIRIDSNISINQLILHSINQNQLALISSNHIFIIKSIDKYTNSQSNDLYVKCFGEKKTIIHFSFHNYDNYYGILLSDGHFYYNSINHLSNDICHYFFQEFNIVSFDFFSLNNNVLLENFMILLMGKNGKLYLGGPIFPKKFTIEKDIINQYNKKSNEVNGKNEESFNNIIKDINTSVIENIIHESVFFCKRNNKLLRYNDQIILKEIIVNKIQYKETIINKNDHSQYKQIIILHGIPLILLRVTTSNIIEIIIINGDSKLLSNLTIQVLYNNCYLVEKIDLNESLFPLSSIKCINISSTQIIIQLMTNVYSIIIPYRGIIKEKIESKSNITKIYLSQFKSQVKKLVKHDLNNKSIPLGYYFIGVIFDELYMITYINNTISYFKINIYDLKYNETYTNNSLIISKQSIITTSTNISINKGNQFNKRELSRQFSFGDNEYNDNEPSNHNSNNQSQDYLHQYIDIINETNQFFLLKYKEYQNQKELTEMIFEKRKKIYDILLSKINHYNNTLESIKVLSIHNKTKKEQIQIQIKRISLKLKQIAMVNLQIYNNSSLKEINQLKEKSQKLEQLANNNLSLLEFKGNNSNKKLNNFSISGIDYISKNNLEYKTKLFNNIKTLQSEIKFYDRSTK